MPWLRISLILSLIVGCASEDRDEPSEEVVVFSEPDAFYTLLNLTESNYIVLSEAELVERSTFIGAGTLC